MKQTPTISLLTDVSRHNTPLQFPGTTQAGADRMVPEEISGRVTGLPVCQPNRHETPVLGPHETLGRRAETAARGRSVSAVAPTLELAHSEADHHAAQAEAAVCQQFADLLQASYSGRMAAQIVSRSASWWSGADSLYQRWLREGHAGLLPVRQADPGAANCSDLTAWIESLGWFIPAARFFNGIINCTRDSGSIPEAIRRTIYLPDLNPCWKQADIRRFLSVIKCAQIPACPDALRQTIQERQDHGQPLVPDRIARQLNITKAQTRFNRNPTNAALDYMNAAGCSRFTRHSGTAVPLRAGQRLQPDDGTINFCVTVPWGFPTDKVSKKYGVMVGRFQLLLMVDALTLCIMARSFVVRPRSSYRQEDALGLYNIFMAQHGIPDEIWHEGHVWNSGRVKDCLDLLQVRRQLLHSPHTKAAVEGRFSKLWTVLSGLTGGQIGRYRGEMERENQLLTSVKDGHTDPHKVFPPIALALPAIDQAITEANATLVQTDVGSWIPAQLCAEQLAETPLRPFDSAQEWMFSPYCLERTITSGFNATLPLFEDFSVPFTFSSEWMPNYKGARAKCYFNPYGSQWGTVVLAESYNHQKPGTILGLAKQTNDIAEYARLNLGLGHGPDDSGRVIRQRQAAAMHSHRKAIIGTGRGRSVVEARDGAGQASATLTVDGAPGTGQPGTSNLPPTTRHEDRSLFRPISAQMSTLPTDNPAYDDF